MYISSAASSVGNLPNLDFSNSVRQRNAGSVEEDKEGVHYLLLRGTVSNNVHAKKFCLLG